MPTPTYTLIDSVTLTSSASSVTFSSISATGKGDLVLAISGKTTSGNTFGKLRANGDSGSTYHYVTMEGDGSSALSGQNTQSGFAEIYWYVTWNATNFNTVVYNLMDFSAGDKHKTALIRSSSSSQAVNANAGRWANTSAITSLTYLLEAGSIAAGSTFHLYQLVSE
jgi:hypothetical protein